MEHTDNRFLRGYCTQYVQFKSLDSEGPKKVIYVLISNLLGPSNEFQSAEYIAQILLSDKYPEAPPHVQFLTPNGITQLAQNISINRFGFHDEGYKPEFGAIGVGYLLPAILLQWAELGNGIGLINQPNITDIKSYAAASKNYNAIHLASIRGLF